MSTNQVATAAPMPDNDLRQLPNVPQRGLLYDALHILLITDMIPSTLQQARPP